MANPVPGYGITTGYKRPGGWSAGYHTGVDHAAPHGAKVVALRSGTVTHVGWGGWGNAYGVQVHIKHGGYVTMVAHLSRTTVRRGQSVREGQQIGNVGTTGRSTGPHAHVETRVSPYGYNNQIRNPAVFYPSRVPDPYGIPVYLSKLHAGQKNSRSVKVLQRHLNKHFPKRKIPLKVTGTYNVRTDNWVRRDQDRHGHKFGQGRPDPKGKSNVGRQQARHLRLRIA